MKTSGALTRKEKGICWRAALLSGAGLLCLTSPALAVESGALPTGGVVAGGEARFDYGAANELHVHQSSNRAVIDWESFNIGANALTQFHQPSSSSLAVNRVRGDGDPTRILGQARAAGRLRYWATM